MKEVFNTEKTANKLANKIAVELNYDSNQQAVMAYGLFALIQIIICIMLVYIFGQMLGVTIEALIVSFSMAALRKYSGGAHASSPGMCALIGTIVAVGFALGAVNIQLSMGSVLGLGIITLVYSLYIINKLAPVDSAAKPIRKEEKRKRLKKQSILALGTYLVIVLIILGFYYKTKSSSLIHYIVCICLGTIWQVTSLTRAGHILLAKIENLFNNIFNLLRRKV